MLRVLLLLPGSLAALRPPVSRLASSGTPNQPIQLVCSDVDGTLLSSSHEISGRTERAVLRVMEKPGVTFCACTGRGRAGAYNALGKVGDRLRARQAPGVFLNGLIVYGPGDKLLRDVALEPEVTLRAAEFAAQQGVSLVGFSGDRSLCERHCEWTQYLAGAKDPEPEVCGPWREIVASQRINKLLLLAPAPKISRLRPALSAELGDAASLTQAVDTMLEVLPRGASKGAGVSVLLEALGVPPAAVLAIGDAENDIGMLERAGVSVAMGQAPPEVKRAATRVTAPTDDDGAASAFEELLLADAAPSAGGQL